MQPFIMQWSQIQASMLRAVFPGVAFMTLWHTQRQVNMCPSKLQSWTGLSTALVWKATSQGSLGKDTWRLQRNTSWLVTMAPACDLTTWLGIWGQPELHRRSHLKDSYVINNQANQKLKRGAEEMVQSVKCKHGRLSSDPDHPCRKPGNILDLQPQH